VNATNSDSIWAVDSVANSGAAKVFSPLPAPRPSSRRSVPDPLGSSGEYAHTNSLTPVNVLQYIHETIILTLGLGEGVGGSHTPLEEEMIASLERIVRKGFCPSTMLARNEHFEALLSLGKCFDREAALIEVDDRNGGKTRAKVLVFSALCQYAREAAYCVRKIKELRADLHQTNVIKRRQKLKTALLKLKQRKEECLELYQKIIFADAAAQRERGATRRIRINGRPATLDELVHYCKQQGLSQSDGSIQLDLSLSRTNIHSSQPPISTSRGNAGQDEVVEWRQIKPKAAP